MNRPIDQKNSAFFPTPWKWIGMGVAVSGLLLPFLALSFFTHPFYDDYMEAVRVQQHGLLGAQRDLYQHHTGRFVTSWLITVANPLVWKWAWGIRVMPFLLLSILSGLLYWVSRLAYPQRARWQHAVLGLGLLLVYLCSITDIYEAVYWFTGAVVYQTGNVCLLLLAISSWLYHRAAQPKVWLWVLASLAVVGAVAANEVALVQTLLLLLLLLGVSWTRAGKQLSRKWWTWLLVLALLVSLFCLLAPGNAQRMDFRQFDNRFQIGYSVWHTLLSVAELVTRPVVWVGLLVVALFTARASRVSEGWQLHPLVALAYWVASISSGFFSFWWLGFGPAPVRTENAIIAGALLALAVCIPPVMRWAHARQAGVLPVLQPSILWLLAAAVLVLVARGAPLRALQQLRYNALPYEQQMQQRYQQLHRARAAGQSSVTVAAINLPKKRELLMHSMDLDTLPGAEVNRMTAAYFGLDSVRVARAGKVNPAP